MQQEVAKAILCQHACEPRMAAESRNCHRNVGWRATGEGTEVLCKAMTIVAFAVHVDQSLAEAKDGTFH
jgi:hypothetical protein